MTKRCPGQAPRRMYPICGRLTGAVLFHSSFVIRYTKASTCSFFLRVMIVLPKAVVLLREMPFNHPKIQN
jgi:hypothetical protein